MRTATETRDPSVSESTIAGGRPVLLATIGVPLDGTATSFALDAAVEGGRSLILANLTRLEPLWLSVRLGYDALEELTPEVADPCVEPRSPPWLSGSAWNGSGSAAPGPSQHCSSSSPKGVPGSWCSVRTGRRSGSVDTDARCRGSATPIPASSGPPTVTSVSAPMCSLVTMRGVGSAAGDASRR